MDKSTEIIVSRRNCVFAEPAVDELAALRAIGPVCREAAPAVTRRLLATEIGTVLAPPLGAPFENRVGVVVRLEPRQSAFQPLE